MCDVAPHAGAWIKTNLLSLFDSTIIGHPPNVGKAQILIKVFVVYDIIFFASLEVGGDKNDHEREFGTCYFRAD